jgi:hypothetical protein
MVEMLSFWFRIVPTVLALVVGLPGIAAEQDDAIAAARQLMKDLGSKDFNRVYDVHTSAWLKARSAPRQTSVTNLVFTRSNFGPLLSSELYDVSQSPSDPQWGYTGPIYVITFKNTYPTGKMLERFSMIKENGLFLMSGMMVAPAPPD